MKLQLLTSYAIETRTLTRKPVVKKTLLGTYKAGGRLVPCVVTEHEKNTVETFQTCQTTTQGTATGCLQMPSEHHSHEETNIILVKEHRHILTKESAML